MFLCCDRTETALFGEARGREEVYMNGADIARSARTLAASAALVICAGSVHAQESAVSFPSRSITLIVPFGAGGPPDSIARVVAAGLSKALGKPVIVENKPGGSTSIASAAVSRAAPDGYTLMAVDISFAVTPHIASNVPADPLKEFKVVGQSAKSVFTLIASPTISTPTLAAFLKLAKEQPDSIKIGHTGVGTTPHLAAMTFIKATGINPLLVPYRAVAEATNNVLAGHISAVFSAASTAVGLAKEGKISVLGVTGNKRMAVLPDVPTFAENGIEMTGFEGGSWYGIVAPAATPDDIVAKLNTALNEAVRDEQVQEKLAAAGLELVGGTPTEFKEFIASQYVYWGESLRAAGIKPEGQ
jgi:tripartite-type tricarboxylate transporter receptor subunit TctC